MAEIGGYTLSHTGEKVDENVGLAGTAVQLQRGYFYDNAFYAEAAHTTVIKADIHYLYIDLPSISLYFYNGTNYVRCGKGSVLWGDITGTLANQPDLDTAIDLKADQTYVDDELNKKVNTTRKVGSNTLAADITAANIINDIKDETKTLTNTTMSGDKNTFSNIALSSIKSQGTTNANKQLVIDASGNVVLSSMKVTYSFSTKIIDSYNHTWFITSVTDGTNTMHTAVSMTNPSLVYHSKDNTNWYLSYSEWRA